MKRLQFQSLLPEMNKPELARALRNPQVREAMADLSVVEAQLEGCTDPSTEKEDWEATKRELLDEIRRLTLRLRNKS